MSLGLFCVRLGVSTLFLMALPSAYAFMHRKCALRDMIQAPHVGQVALGMAGVQAPLVQQPVHAVRAHRVEVAADDDAAGADGAPVFAAPPLPQRHPPQDVAHLGDAVFWVLPPRLEVHVGDVHELQSADMHGQHPTHGY